MLQQYTSNKENKASLPGDPQANLFVKLHPKDVNGLIDNGNLRMNLLDFILHLMCTYSSDMSDINYCLGGSLSEDQRNKRNLKVVQTIGRL